MCNCILRFSRKQVIRRVCMCGTALFPILYLSPAICGQCLKTESVCLSMVLNKNIKLDCNLLPLMWLVLVIYNLNSRQYKGKEGILRFVEDMHFYFFQCSVIPRFSIKIRTRYENNNGSSENVSLKLVLVQKLFYLLL